MSSGAGRQRSWLVSIFRRHSNRRSVLVVWRQRLQVLHLRSSGVSICTASMYLRRRVPGRQASASAEHPCSASCSWTSDAHVCSFAIFCTVFLSASAVHASSGRVPCRLVPASAAPLGAVSSFVPFRRRFSSGRSVPFVWIVMENVMPFAHCN